MQRWWLETVWLANYAQIVELGLCDCKFVWCQRTCAAVYWEAGGGDVVCHPVAGCRFGKCWMVDFVATYMKIHEFVLGLRGDDMCRCCKRHGSVCVVEEPSPRKSTELAESFITAWRNPWRLDLTYGWCWESTLLQKKNSILPPWKCCTVLPLQCQEVSFMLLADQLPS